MCGIFCAISFSEPFGLNDYKIFVQATNKVIHRGPNSFGYKTFKSNQELSENSFNIFFGHRRLSVIDLSDQADQPMESNGINIIYNGEIFNYLELKKELIKAGCIFKTNSDTEVILKIYEKYGSLGFAKLNGMWAFILYDSQKNLLIVSRDRFSIKPLFFYKNRNKIYFASEVKQLIHFIPSNDFNENIMSCYLRQGLLDHTNETFYNNILRLEPKTNLIVSFKDNSIVKEKYWNYNLCDYNESEVEDKFLDLFYDSVKIRLRSDVNLGLLLSGGLDSSAIATVLKELGIQKIETYTVISDNLKYSEEKFADLMSSELNVPNHKLRFDSNEVLKDIEEVFCFQDEPFNSFSVVAQYSIFRKIKSESDLVVILSGQGGDELLLGYLRYYFYYLNTFLKKKQYHQLFVHLIMSLVQRTMITQFRLSMAKRYMPKTSQSKDFLIKPYNNEEQLWDITSIQNSQITDIDKYSVPILARYEDRNSMAHSLESRLPFLDYRLVEFLISLDYKFKFRRGWNKYILRSSFKQMPSKIRWRRDKKGFSIPEEVWLKREFRTQIQGCFKNSYLNKMGYVDDKKFLKYYDNFLLGSNHISFYDIGRIFIAEKWIQSRLGLC